MAYLNNGLSFPRTAKNIKALVGNKIEYLLERDIDKSGRGYFWPKIGVVTAQAGKNAWIDGEPFFWREIREYRIIE